MKKIKEKPSSSHSDSPRRISLPAPMVLRKWEPLGRLRIKSGRRQSFLSKPHTEMCEAFFVSSLIPSKEEDYRQSVFLVFTV